MEPEIARRCVSCGAAVRGQASFCPQCGAGIGKSPAAGKAATGAADNPATPPPVEEKPAADAVNRTRAFSGEEYLAISDELARHQARIKAAAEKYGATVLPGKQKADLRVVAAQVRVEMQAKEQARNEQPQPAQDEQTERAKGEQERGRNERQHEVSFVLLNDTPDDSTLRFILIAIALFVLFLLILLFSHILG